VFASTYPPRWLHWVTASVLTASLLVASSPTGLRGEGWEIFDIAVIGLTLPIWAVLFAAMWITRRVMRFKGEEISRRRWSWFVFPLLVGAYLTLLVNGTVFHVRWSFAKDDFGAAAAAIERGESVTLPAWYGTFRVCSAHIAADGTVTFGLSGSEWYSDGAAWLERGVAAPSGSPCSAGIGDDWWLLWDNT
jgi:hypothetical protein